MRPDSSDSERRLTPDGKRHVLELSAYSRAQGITVDRHVLERSLRPADPEL
jgi:phosphohistidine phosphatase SixA